MGGGQSAPAVTQVERPQVTVNPSIGETSEKESLCVAAGGRLRAARHCNFQLLACQLERRADACMVLSCRRNRMQREIYNKGLNDGASHVMAQQEERVAELKSQVDRYHQERKEAQAREVQRLVSEFDAQHPRCVFVQATCLFHGLVPC